MASIKLKGDTSGEITLTTPSTLSNGTLNIPDTTGNIITSGDTGSISTAMLADDSVTNAKIGSGAVGATELASTLDLSGKTVTLPAGTGGKILQVLQVTKTNTFSTSSQSFVDVTGLSVSITPSSSSSKILVIASLALGNNGTHSDARLMRNTTAIAIGDASSNRTRSTFHLSSVSNTDIPTPSITWLDSPATTSATTYKMQVAVPYSSSYVIYVNRGADDSDAGYAGRLASSITVMEVAG